MAAINFGSTVSLAQAAKLIIHNPDNIICLQGPPGIGKSSIMAFFKAHFGGAYNYAYFDCASKDLGDVTMPVPNRELQVTEYFPNAVLQFHAGKPMVVILDEYSKAPQPVQNMLHPFFEIEKRLGDKPLPPGSIIVVTGNNTSDGVGDNLKAHTLNRMTTIEVRPPTSEEWVQWAVSSGKIDPVLIAWVDRFPHAMAYYRDGGQDDNPYIFNPKKVQRGFVSGRSLERASSFITNRAHYDNDALINALIGTLGEAAARDIQAFIAFQDQLPPWDSIITEPKHARIPDSSGACAVLVFGAVTKVDRNNIDQFMVYLDRLAPEWQAAFCITIARDPAKQAIAFSNKSFAKWVLANEDII
jgi:hypothetical protein